MLRRSNILLFVPAVAVLFVLGAVKTSSFAQKDSVPKPRNTLALGEDEVKQLLLLIDTNKSGKITKQQWMKFMDAEFDRLDTNKTGELDARELAQSRLRVSHFGSAGK
jgi:EF hand